MDRTDHAKLILLKIAASKHEICRDELLATAIDTLTVDYFLAADALAKLCGDGFLVAITPQKAPQTNLLGQKIEWLSLTKAGQDVLEALESQLTEAQRQYIEHQEIIQAELNQDLSPHVSLVKLPGRACELELRLTSSDNNPIKLTVTVPTHELAKTISDNWLGQASSKYALIMDLLFLETK